MPKKGRAQFKGGTEHTGVRLPAPQLEWLKEKVRKGEFASVSHGIRRCIQKAMEGEKG